MTTIAINPKIEFLNMNTYIPCDPDGGANGDKTSKQPKTTTAGSGNMRMLKKRISPPKSGISHFKKLNFLLNRGRPTYSKICSFPRPKLHSFESSTDGVRNDHQGVQPWLPMGPTGPHKWRKTRSPEKNTKNDIIGNVF